MEGAVPAELFWLTLTVAMTGIIWVPYILDRVVVRGLMGAMANPAPGDAPQSAWARRMMAAHANAIENLAVFAPLVLILQHFQISSSVTVFACALFFWARLVHLTVYTLGIPVLRTLSFAAGFAAQALLALAAFRLL
jgi:uncharacterized MAPEG superfamily protein